MQLEFLLRRRLTVGRFRGIPIRIDPSWILVSGLVFFSLSMVAFPRFFEDHSTLVHWSMGALATAGLFFSILAHELAHALVAQRRGTEVEGITLFLLGGMAEMRDEPRTPPCEILIAGAGPACSLLVGVLLWVFTQVGISHGWPAPVNGTLGYLSILNLLLGVFNLAPAFPLDGGRLLRAGLWWISGDYDRCTRIAVRIGVGLAWASVLAGALALILGRPLVGLWLAMTGLFMRGAAKKAWERIDEEAEEAAVDSSGPDTTPRLPEASPVER